MNNKTNRTQLLHPASTLESRIQVIFSGVFTAGMQGLRLLGRVYADPEKMSQQSMRILASYPRGTGTR
ncbi:MAG: hypothetical protein P8X74_15770 [Reinekea sp.]